MFRRVPISRPAGTCLRAARPPPVESPASSARPVTPASTPIRCRAGPARGWRPAAGLLRLPAAVALLVEEPAPAAISRTAPTGRRAARPAPAADPASTRTRWRTPIASSARSRLPVTRTPRHWPSCCRTSWTPSTMRSGGAWPLSCYRPTILATVLQVTKPCITVTRVVLDS